MENNLLHIETFIKNFHGKDFKETLLEKNPNLQIKEDDNIYLIHYNKDNKNTLNELEKQCRSIIIDKNTLDIICYQAPEILTDEFAEKYLIENKIFLNKVKIEQCYKETVINVFFHADKWYITTRCKIDSKESKWINNLSYYDIFMDCINNKFTLSDLNKNYVYLFVLIDYRNKNIIDYSDKFNTKKYNKIIHLDTYEKNTMTNIDDEFFKNYKAETFKFKNLDELKFELEKKNDKITNVGYIIKVNGNILIFHTKLYRVIESIRPNYSNIFSNYISLYFNKKLKLYLKYVNDTNSTIDGIYSFIKKSIMSLCIQLHQIYLLTLDTKIYTLLPYSYKYLINKLDKYKIENTSILQLEDIVNIIANKLNIIYIIRIIKDYKMLHEKITKGTSLKFEQSTNLHSLLKLSSFIN